MLKLINYLIVALLPLVPKKIVGLFAKRYVAGETVPDALATAKALNDRGFVTTLDILGEHVKTNAEAKDITDRYVALYQKIADAGVDANISVKPTHLGIDLGVELCRENLFAILDAAKAQNNFLRIDMENSPYTDQTIEVYRACQGRYPSVGLVIQAYLLRSARDITELAEAPLNFRLCKGIYREAPEIAISDRQAINSNFLDLMLIIQINCAGSRSSKALCISVHPRRTCASGDFFNRRSGDAVSFAKGDNVFSF